MSSTKLNQARDARDSLLLRSRDLTGTLHPTRTGRVRTGAAGGCAARRGLLNHRDRCRAVAKIVVLVVEQGHAPREMVGGISLCTKSYVQFRRSLHVKSVVVSLAQNVYASDAV